MSSVKELEEKVKELMKEIETLKQKEKEEEFEYPFEDKEEYFCLNINGEIIHNLWWGGPFDEGVYTQGHVFKNREEARKERDKRYLLMRFNQFRGMYNCLYGIPRIMTNQDMNKGTFSKLNRKQYENVINVHC